MFTHHTSRGHFGLFENAWSNQLSHILQSVTKQFTKSHRKLLHHMAQNRELKNKTRETECDPERKLSLSAYQGQLMADDIINSGRSDFI